MTFTWLVNGKIDAQTPRNSLSIALSAGYSSVLTAGGASDRRWLKACCTNGLTYLLTYLLTYYSREEITVAFAWHLNGIRMSSQPWNGLDSGHGEKKRLAVDFLNTFKQDEAERQQPTVCAGETYSLPNVPLGTRWTKFYLLITLFI